jgi:glycosyltransferase involved in cell wall biosynthesis/tetratricopeptide (TPR) repeat protein
MNTLVSQQYNEKKPAAASRGATHSGAIAVRGVYETSAEAGATGWIELARGEAGPVELELWIDGQACGSTLASASTTASKSNGANSRLAFKFVLPTAVFDGVEHVLEVRTAVEGLALPGGPKLVRFDPGTAVAASSKRFDGSVESLDHNGINGWAAAVGIAAPLDVVLFVDGRPAGSARADKFRQDLRAAGIHEGRHGYVLPLPADVFDGKPHRINVYPASSSTPLRTVSGEPMVVEVDAIEWFRLTPPNDVLASQQRATAALDLIEARADADLGPRDLAALKDMRAWLRQQPFVRSQERVREQIERIGALRVHFELLGFDTPNVIAGSLSDAWAEHRQIELALLERDKTVAETRCAADGRFTFELPAALQDGALHTFCIRAQALDLTFGPWHFVTTNPSHTASADDEPDPVWRGLARPPATPAAAPPIKPPDPVALARASAQELLTQTEDKHPTRTASALLAWATALMDECRWSEAQQVSRQARERDPESLDAIEALARALAGGGSDVQAMALLREAMAQHPDASRLNALADQVAARRRVHDARVVAFYLPQFHPVAENNEWWGEGFTEWANVGGATPLFEGHLQPRRPTALGYYDLRLAEAANAQFELARRYGIDGFCYYYYWFEGRRILEKPLQDLVDGRTGPFPFCICWANEDWTRSWDGASGEVLLAQNHSEESDFRFIEDLAPLLRHPDYIRVDGRPMLLIYRADKLAEPKRTVERWRQWCRDEGIGELHLCAVQSFGFDDPRPLGFDAAVEFPPHCLWERYRKPGYLHEMPAQPGMVEGFQGKTYDWQAYARAAMARPREAYTLHRTSMAAWDNTARRQKTAHVYHGYSVPTFERWVEHNARQAALEQQDGVCFINAWNEWAEGTVLEPDAHFGYETLEATRRALRRVRMAPARTYWRKGRPQQPAARLAAREHVLLVGHDAFPAGAQTNLLNMARCLKRQLNTEVSIFLLSGGELLPEYERVAPTQIIGDDAQWRTRLSAKLNELAARGVRKAICNTVLTGDVAELLKSRGFKVVGLIHEMPTIIGAGGFQAQCWRMADKTDALVCASSKVANAYAQQYWPDAGKMLVAPQGIVPNSHVTSGRAQARLNVRKQLGLAQDALIVMGCGYGDTRKGIDLFVLLAGAVLRNIGARTVSFVWVGDVADENKTYVQADMRRLGLEGRLHITGFTKEAPLYFAAADLFALTSREDPFPSVVMEAFDGKMPVLGFDGAGGFVDIVNADTGALVPYLDVGAMAQAACELLTDDARRAAIGERNHQLCRERFAYAPYMRKLLALLAGVPAEQVAAGHLERQAWFAPRATPTISVIVPNYNYAEYLELRLRSILAQTLAPTEIIVLDDASADGSLEIVRAMAAESPIPMRVLTSERNSGNPFVQWARGLQEAQGELVWIAEADDYCEPTLLETLAAELADDKVVMAWADSIMVDSAGRSSGSEYKQYYARSYGAKWHTHFRMAGRELIDDCLFTENVVPNASAVLFKRSALKFDLAPLRQYRFSGDWWFWLFLARQGDVVYRADPLNYHRRHAKSVMGEVLRSGQKLLPETMGFYRRLAQAAPDCVSSNTARSARARLQQLYGMFPELASQSPKLASHPAFAADHEALANALRQALDEPHAASYPALPAEAVLLVSADVLSEGGSGHGLIDGLAVRHRLQVIVASTEDSAKSSVDSDWLKTLNLPRGVAMQLLALHKPTGGPAATGDAAHDEHIQRLVQQIGPAPLLYSHGLLAHCLVAKLPQEATPQRWLLVADRDFDALLGRPLTHAGVDLATLEQALRQCTQATFLGPQPPHAFARLAQTWQRALDRLVLPEAPKRTQSTAPDEDAPLRLLGLAHEADVADWRRLAQAVGDFAQEHGLAVELRLLSWGKDLAAANQLQADFAYVRAVALSSPPTQVGAIGDVALAWPTASVAPNGRAHGTPSWCGALPAISLPAASSSSWSDELRVQLIAALPRKPRTETPPTPRGCTSTTGTSVSARQPAAPQ